MKYVPQDDFNEENNPSSVLDDYTAELLIQASTMPFEAGSMFLRVYANINTVVEKKYRTLDKPSISD